MFWFRKPGKKSQDNSAGARHKSRRNLRFESLENRRVLASGIVNVALAPFAPPGTSLALIGDGSNNEVDISQTLNVGEYLIQGKNGTLLQLNGSFATTPSMTVHGINFDIDVDLGNGNDVFRFLARPDSQPSNIPEDLNIENSDGSNINSLTGVLINGDLHVSKVVGTSGYSELSILSSTIIGSTIVDNTSGGPDGDTKTVIDNSWLQGSVPGPAFSLTNGAGADINNIRGNSQFGIGPYQTSGPVVAIANGAGGSQTTFTGASAVAGFGTTTVYGQLNIDNGLNLPGFVDLVTFDGTNVLGPVNVANGDGNALTGVTNSTLGSHLVLNSLNAPAYGGPMLVVNGSGYDEFSMTGSNLPWGLLINNDSGVPGANWGSSTAITQSSIGTGPYGPRLPAAGDAMIVLGDDGRDLVNVNSTTIGGRLDLQLKAGNNELNVTNNSVMSGLYIVTSNGNDKVLIDKSKILVDVYARLGNGADELYVRNLVFATDWPSSLLGSVDINGELGVDRTNLGTLVPMAFELLVP